MSPHWRLALWCGLLVAAGSSVVGVVIYYYYGLAHAGAFGYGAAVGITGFVSVALTVSLITARSAILKMVGGGTLVARYLYAAAALGVPAYREMWPVLPMAAGFMGSYLAENLVMLPGFARIVGVAGVRREEEN